MNPLFEPNPKIANLARVCDEIKASREAAGREQWNDAERRRFHAAAKGCGVVFPAAVQRRDADDSEARIRQREAEEMLASAERRVAARQPQPRRLVSGTVYANDDDDRPLVVK